MDTTLAIIGAGPYGLSIASHALDWHVPHQLFGDPMAFWRANMPDSMLVRSLGRSTSLSHPAGQYTLPKYLEEQGIGWEEGKPYPKSLFLEYVDYFQRQTGVTASDRWVTRLSRQGDHFSIECGEDRLRARYVVVATGLTYFQFVPKLITDALPDSRHAHSSQIRTADNLAGRRVAVIGGGQSAYEYALLAAQAGAIVTVARRSSKLTVTGVHNPYSRRFMTMLCKSSPVFYRLPRLVREPLRRRMLPTTVAPWVLSEMRDTPVSVLYGAKLSSLAERGDAVLIRFQDGRQLEADYVISATGYHVDLARLGLLDDALKAEIAVADGSPVLDNHYQSSVPGLFFAGAMAMESYGPAYAFVCGVYAQCKAMVDDYLGPRAGIGRVARTRSDLPATTTA